MTDTDHTPSAQSDRPPHEHPQARNDSAERDRQEGYANDLVAYTNAVERDLRAQRTVKGRVSTGGGNVTFGDYHVTNAFHLTGTHSGGSSSDAPFGPEEIETLCSIRVATASEDELARRLASDDRIVLLKGRDDSGRRTAALGALARLGAPTKDRPLMLVRPSPSIEALAERVDGGASGYLLDATGMGWLGESPTTGMAKLRSALGEHDSYLVVLVDEDDQVGQVRLHTVVHDPPDRNAVFERSLAWSLLPHDGGTPSRSEVDTAVAGRAARLRERVRTVESVGAWLETFESPADASALARLLAEETERGDAVDSAALDAVVAEVRTARLRSIAQNLLRGGSAAHAPVDQAYVIAAAVLDGCRLATIIDAAENLAARLQKVELPDGKWRRRTFARPLARRLRHVDTELWGAETGADDSKDTVVTLKQPPLRNVIVDVVWQEYEAARRPMRDWLVHLCEVSPDAFRDDAVNVQIGVDLALTRLAQHDFEQIVTKVLDPWAGMSSPFAKEAQSPSERERDAWRVRHCPRVVAWVMEHLVVGGVQRTRALELLERWMRDRDHSPRHTAVLAFGTRIAESEPDRALTAIKNAFQRLDLDPMTRGGSLAGYYVAAALEGAYDAGMRYRAVHLLTTQASPQGPASTVAAVQALLRIASLDHSYGEGVPRGDQPDLLAWLDAPYLAPGDRPLSGSATPDIEELTAGIARLWAIALAMRNDETLNRSAWNVLHHWDTAARSPETGSPGLRGRMNRILGHLRRAEPSLREEIEHYEKVRDHIAAYRRTGASGSDERRRGEDGTD